MTATSSEHSNGAVKPIGNGPVRAEQVRIVREIETLHAEGFSVEDLAKEYKKTPQQISMILTARVRLKIKHSFRDKQFLQLEARAQKAFYAAGISELAHVDRLTYEMAMHTDGVGNDAWNEIVQWKTDNSAAITKARLKADQAHIRHVAAAPSKTEIVKRGGLLGGNGKAPAPAQLPFGPAPPAQNAMAYVPPPRQPATGGTPTHEAPKAHFKGSFCPHCGEKLI